MSEKFQVTSTSRKFKRQHYWQQHIFFRRSYPSSDNKDKETLKLEKKYCLMNWTLTIIIILITQAYTCIVLFQRRFTIFTINILKTIIQTNSLKAPKLSTTKYKIFHFLVENRFYYKGFTSAGRGMPVDWGALVCCCRSLLDRSKSLPIDDNAVCCGLVWLTFDDELFMALVAAASL